MQATHRFTKMATATALVASMVLATTAHAYIAPPAKEKQIVANADCNLVEAPSIEPLAKGDKNAKAHCVVSWFARVSPLGNPPVHKLEHSFGVHELNVAQKPNATKAKIQQQLVDNLRSRLVKSETEIVDLVAKNRPITFILGGKYAYSGAAYCPQVECTVTKNGKICPEVDCAQKTINGVIKHKEIFK